MATLTIPSQARSSGILTTASVSWPSTLAAAEVVLAMPIQAERNNSSNVLELRVEASRDGGTTWKPYAMAGWRGGSGIVRGGVTNPPPAIVVSGEAGLGLVRLGLTLSNPMTVGATITTK